MGNDLPYVPFDPEEVGPFELIGRKWSRLKEAIAEHPLLTLAGTVATGTVWWYLDLGVPNPPNWFWVAVLGMLLAVVVAWPVSKKVAAALHDPDYVVISEQNAITGDQRLIQISPDRFQELTVKNQNDREVSREYLHEVIINGVRAYEVDRYHEEENVAIASWQAGVSNSQMRRKQSQITKIKQDLEEEANKALEALANNPDAVRQVAAEVSNDIIRTAEKVENPNGDQLHERMTQILEDVDDTDDLITDNSKPDDGLETSDGADPDGDTQSISIEVSNDD